MKLFKTDLSIKYFILETEEKSYLITFKTGLFKGFYDVEIRETELTKGHPSYRKIDAEVVETSPSLVGTIKWLVHTTKNKLKKIIGFDS